ncbi:hypothetical protein [Stratiformator vulcanicus]|uniref:Carboxypeptidase regulatory-like domain-containing protein n=1 Tax=Stratiformator vulcanicus TaxID=2527980 RepID=A0A517QZ19_9PLAN|nr:hypothetical protein [Stratiformator vulcanicus]QDT36843.1 hypothetical protein Pan189_12060 [Stratiformator vulcanicus]
MIRQCARFSSIAVATFSLLLVGCGESYQMGTTPVSGKVTCNGEPVTSGSIVFRPHAKPGENAAYPGKPAIGQIQSDGSYTVSTYTEGDGAIIGKHTVRLQAPEPDVAEGEEPPGPEEEIDFPCNGSELEIEVMGGEGTVNLDFT